MGVINLFKKKSKARGLDAIRNRYGYTFVIHWVLGLVIFFLVPLISSIWYCFNNVTIGSGGVESAFAGLKHFITIIKDDASYLDNLRDSLGSIFYSLPIIIALSLILAVVLNQKFAGRTVFRAIFFLPVIIASSVVLTHMQGPYVNAPLFTFGSTSSTGMSGASVIDFESMISGLNLPTQVSEMLSSLLGNVFGLIWSCGVQTILFLAGLQSISESLYEVSKIEGANKWEEFWFITVPMLRHVMTLVIIYTMIELFTAVDNPVMQQSYTLMQEKQIYDRSSAMLWLYFSIVIAVMAIVLLLYNRYCMKKWE